MLLNPYVWLAGLLLLAGSFGAGWYKGSASVESRIAAEAAKHAETVTQATDKVVVQYVDKIERIPSPPVIRTRLVERVCPGSSAGVPRPGSPAASPAPDAGDRLAADIRSCKANSDQLEALIAAVRANNDHRPPN